MKVLIVDDEILVRKGITMGVDWKSLGFDSVEEASNGLDALNYAKVEYPNLVLTDIKMPKMDGLELIEKLKQYCPDTVVIVLSCVDDADYVRRAMKFGGAVDYILKLSLSTDELTEIIKRVKPTLIQKHYDKHNSIEETREDRIFNNTEYIQLSQEDERIIVEALESTNEQSLKAIVGRLFVEARNKEIASEDFHLMNDILGFLNAECRRRQGNINTIRIHNAHPYSYISSSTSLDVMENRSLVVIDMVISYLDSLRHHKYGTDIIHAIDYIHSNYSKNISLSDVSQEVGLNSAYLSRKFKEETKVNFVDYINNLRIEKAKVLLKETRIPVNEVASEVGYSNDTYFSRIFKSFVGISPKQYQKQGDL